MIASLARCRRAHNVASVGPAVAPVAPASPAPTLAVNGRIEDQHPALPIETERGLASDHVPAHRLAESGFHGNAESGLHLEPVGERSPACAAS